MKNLLRPNVAKEIHSRIYKLKSDAKAQWGKLNVNQGLRHMSIAFDISTGKLNCTIAKVPPMPKWLLKFFPIEC